MLLRALQERAGWIGRWVAGLIGMAWTVASFLVVPILVTRNVGPIEAVKESALLLKRTWGENVIGQGGIGLVFGLINVLIVGLGIGLIVAAAMTKTAILIGLAVAAMVIALMLCALIQAALSGIYSAALYRFASGEGETQGFDSNLLSQAFAPKR
jgi:hypothetical protein